MGDDEPEDVVAAAHKVADENNDDDEEDVHVELLRVAGTLVVVAVNVAIDEFLTLDARQALRNRISK